MQDLKNTIYGFAIGDACGIPYKSLKRDTFNCKKMTSCEEDSLFTEEVGTWSDDTSLTLCMMDALCEKSTNNIQPRYEQNCINWLYNGAFSASGVSFDVSSTNRKMIESFEKGTTNEFANKERSNSNNGLTKISPVAFLDLQNDAQKMALIKMFNKYSNNHPVSNAGCLIYIKILENLRKYKDIEKAVQELSIESKYELEEYDHILNCDVLEFNRNQIWSTNYVVDTLTSAIWAVNNSSSFADAIFNAVNLGGDTDAIAAITGSFAGLIYEIPLGFIYSLKNRQEIDRVLTKFTKIYCKN